MTLFLWVQGLKTGYFSTYAALKKQYPISVESAAENISRISMTALWAAVNRSFQQA